MLYAKNTAPSWSKMQTQKTVVDETSTRKDNRQTKNQTALENIWGPFINNVKNMDLTKHRSNTLVQRCCVFVFYFILFI